MKLHYVKLTTGEAFPRLSVVRSTKGIGVYLGPISNRRTADLVVEALHTVIPLRRCNTRIGRSRAPKQNGLCTAAQLGKAVCPCTGELSVEDYAPVVEDAVRLMTTHPHVALDRLRERMEELAAQERFEDAALTRNRAGALANSVDRSRRLKMVEQLGAVSLQFTSGVVRIDSSDLSIEESLLVGGWIDRHADRAKVLVGSDALASPLPRLGNFTPRKAPTLT